MSDNLALKIANKHVHSYADAPLMQRHAEAMDCRDCEDYLRNGILALRWLRNADETMREAVSSGLCEFDREVQDEVHALYRAWLGPCEQAEAWIARLAERGYTPDNLDEFRKACEEVQGIVEQIEWQNIASQSRLAASASEDW